MSSKKTAPVASHAKSTKVSGGKRTPSKTRGNPAFAREAATARRKFIYTKVREEKGLTFGEIRNAFKGVKKKAIEEDVQFFRRHGVEFDFSRAGGELTIVDSEASNLAESGYREEYHSSEKLLVAKAVAGLITCGFRGEEPVVESNDGIPSSKQIQQCISTFAEDRRNIRDGVKLDQKIKEISKSNSKLIALDSGTTNEHTAHVLAGIPMPLADRELAYLSICTNSRKIFNIIGEKKVKIRAIITGGQQRGDASTLAGVMTELFLRQTAFLQFDFAIIGAICVDPVDGGVYTSSQEEAIVKQVMYSRSTVKVLAVDNFKLRMRVGAKYSFARVNPDQIDLIITNAPLEGQRSNEPQATAAVAEFRQSIQDLRRLQVPIMVVKSDDTHSELQKKSFPSVWVGLTSEERKKNLINSLEVE
jgi:DeoR/GlpR family transcriptional regulator of sugar metabolism